MFGKQRPLIIPNSLVATSLIFINGLFDYWMIRLSLNSLSHAYDHMVGGLLQPHTVDIILLTLCSIPVALSLFAIVLLIRKSNRRALAYAFGAFMLSVAIFFVCAFLSFT